MAQRDFSGLGVVKVLTVNGFNVVSRTGSHVTLRYDHPDDEDDVRTVTVPMHDRLRIGTLRKIATQSGAKDFEKRCRWIDRQR